MLNDKQELQSKYNELENNFNQVVKELENISNNNKVTIDDLNKKLEEKEEQNNKINEELKQLLKDNKEEIININKEHENNTKELIKEHENNTKELILINFNLHERLKNKDKYILNIKNMNPIKRLFKIYPDEEHTEEEIKELPIIEHTNNN